MSSGEAESLTALAAFADSKLAKNRLSRAKASEGGLEEVSPDEDR
jgi:hypothetical protein